MSKEAKQYIEDNIDGTDTVDRKWLEYHLDRFAQKVKGELAPKRGKTVEEREQEFANLVRGIETELPSSEVERFIFYWTERNINGRKMKFEKQKTFDPKRRLATWANFYFEKKAAKPNSKLKLTKEDLEL